MKLYITNLSLVVLIIFYLPLVLWIFSRIWRSLQLPKLQKTAVLMLAILLAYAIPLGDVTVNSIAMAKACQSAGLHIYKTVEVEGFAGHYSLYGSPYQYLEYPTLRTDGSYYWRRFEKNLDGSISEKKLEQPTAEYEVGYEQWHADRARGIEASRYFVRNRISGEILAERNLFNPLPGWLDKVLVIRWFGTGDREGCHGAPAAGINVTKILIPISGRSNERG